MRKVQHIKSCSTGKSRALRGISHEFSVELLLVSTLRVKHPCMNNAFLTLFVLWSYPMWQTRSCTITKRRVLSWSWTAWPKITVVSHKYAPLFCNLSLSTKLRGWAYTRDATISLVITPSLSVEWSVTSFWGRWAGPSVRQRDAPDASGRLWWASALSGEEAGCFRKVAGMHEFVDAGGLLLIKHICM